MYRHIVYAAFVRVQFYLVVGNMYIREGISSHQEWSEGLGYYRLTAW
jgi:hypothetical protein